MEWISHSAGETQKLAKEILKHLKSNIICLSGEMGAGKTTLVQGIARELGVLGRVISPTFVLIRSYPIDLRFRRLWHIDLYRLGDIEQIRHLGLEEIINDKSNLVVVEWAERMEGLVPIERTTIRLEVLSEQKRKITMEP